MCFEFIQNIDDILQKQNHLIFLKNVYLKEGLCTLLNVKKCAFLNEICHCL